MNARQYILPLRDKIVADWFAGGGGMAEGIQAAIGRHVDVSCNHDADAISMHMANHPQAIHFHADVREVCARVASQGLPVRLFHMSPDCTHHSQAKGGQPRDRSIRALSWIGLRWGGQVKPDIITLENVKQILQWGPLIAKRDKVTGRVVKLDGTVAAPGERVPLGEQFLIPDPRRAGETWRRFVGILRSMGYVVDWRVLCAADYGVPTTRSRLFMVARCDGAPIVWPEPTHFKNPKPGQKRWRSAAECIDWSIESRSIFGRKRPLAEATMRRVAAGMRKYVLDSADPFIVPVKTWGGGGNGPRSVREPMRTTVAKPDMAVVSPVMVPVSHGDDRVNDPRDPLPTITTARGGEFAVAAASLVKFRFDSAGASLHDPMPTVTAGGASKRDAGAAHALGVQTAVMVQAGHGDGKPGRAQRWGLGAKDIREPAGTVTASGGGGGQALATASLVQVGNGEREGQAPRCMDIQQPLGTVVGARKHGLVTALMAQANGGFNETEGHDMREPMSTITNKGSQQQLVTAHLAHLRGNCDARDAREPLRTVSAGGEHHGVVSYTLSKEDEEGALRCAAFLMRYHGDGGQWSDLKDPMTTITTRDRLALVTVWLKGEPWVIVDIQLRMLTPRELYRANGFPDSYIIERGHDGRVFSKAKQIKHCGNSVPPGLAKAVVAAQWNSKPAAARRAA